MHLFSWQNIPISTHIPLKIIYFSWLCWRSEFDGISKVLSTELSESYAEWSRLFTPLDLIFDINVEKTEQNKQKTMRNDVIRIGSQNNIAMKQEPKAHVMRYEYELAHGLNHIRIINEQLAQGDRHAWCQQSIIQRKPLSFFIILSFLFSAFFLFCSICYSLDNNGLIRPIDISACYCTIQPFRKHCQFSIHFFAWRAKSPKNKNQKKHYIQVSSWVFKCVRVKDVIGSHIAFVAFTSKYIKCIEKKIL